MPYQTYLVRCRVGSDVEAIKRVALQVRSINGLVLMATRQGGIVAAFDDRLVERVKGWLDVDFVGGVTLAPHGAAAEQLRHIFASHLALQVAAPTEPPTNPTPIGD